MGSKSSAPAAPDPYATANAQAGYDKNTAAYNAALNRYNVYTPFGSQTWTQNGSDASGAPQYTQNINLTPEAQKALQNTQQTQAGLSSLQNAALGGVQQTLAKNPFDQSVIPANPINPGQTAQQAIMARLQPQMDLQNQQFQSDMANRGIPVGSTAYNDAYRTLQQGQNDAMQQAALNGIGLDISNRQNAIQQQGYYANAPLNYLNALMTGSQVQTPQFQSTPATMANAPNYMQAAQNAYQGQLNAYNSGVGSSNSMMGGLFSLGGSLLGAPGGSAGASLISSIFSDANLKTDIRKIGERPDGIGVYSYEKFGEREVGVIAQEVLEKKPEAVSRHPSGYLMVDYEKLQ